MSINFQIKDGYCQRILDVICSIILEFFIIMSWHGLWTWEDRAIFAYDFDNPESKSAWITLLVGTVISLFMIFAQFPLTRDPIIYSFDGKSL